VNGARDGTADGGAESGPHPTFVCDPETGRLLDANGAFHEFHGSDPSGTTDRSVAELYGFDDGWVERVTEASGSAVVPAPAREDVSSVELWHSTVGIVGRVRTGGGPGTAEATLEKIRNLHHAATTVVAASDPQSVYEASVETAKEVLGFDVCAVFVARGDALERVASSDPESLTHESIPIDEAVAGETYRENRSILVGDFERHPTADPGSEVLASGLSVPFGDEAVFRAISTVANDFDRRDLELVELLARHVEGALDRIASEAELRETNEKLANLLRFGSETERYRTHEELFEGMASAAEEILELDLCTIGVVRDDRVELAASTSAIGPDDYREPRLDTDDPDLGVHTILTGETYLIDDLTEDDTAKPVEEYRSALSVPIGNIGVFQAVSYDVGAFDERDRELTELLVTHAAEAYDRIEAEETLRRRRKDLALLKQILSRVLRHNTRNDLNVIQTWAEMIPGASPQRTESLVERITDRVEDLVATSDKARQMESVIDSADSTTEYDLGSVVRGAVAEVQRSHPVAELRTDVERSPTVRSHPSLPLAFETLIENGVVHDPDEPSVTVTVDAVGDDGRVVIEDTGPGIPPQEIEVIEGGTETAFEHGSGAGLWVAKQTIDYSGGELSFSTDDGGTTVTVTLPAVSTTDDG